MLKLYAVVAVLLVSLLAGCTKQAPLSLDIGKVVNVKARFSSEYQVKDIPITGIEPRLFATIALPQGLKFDPPECSKFIISQQIPQGVQGNMAAVTAEGRGNRFIIIALETSEPLPMTAPGTGCQKIAFTDKKTRGLVEVIDSPKISGMNTVGVHRVMQAMSGKKVLTGELYTYTAYSGPYRIMVIANPLVKEGHKVVKVDTDFAQELLRESAQAVRS